MTISPRNSETICHCTIGPIDAQNKNGLCLVAPQNKQTFVPQLRYILKELHSRTLLAADRRPLFTRGSRQHFVGEAWSTHLGWLDYDGVHLARVPCHILNTLASEWRIGLMDTEQNIRRRGVITVLLTIWEHVYLETWIWPEHCLI